MMITELVARTDKMKCSKQFIRQIWEYFEKIRCSRDSDITYIFKETGWQGVGWIKLAQEREKG